MVNVADNAIAVFIQTHAQTIIKITGRDAGNFLHRMSTQDIQNMQTNDLLLTAFVNAKGRLVDVIAIQAMGNEAFLLYGYTYPAQHLTAWLQQFLFLEDICIEDYSHQGNAPFCAESDRISKGYALGPLEVCEEYNPLELGLKSAISWNKGCYIGQEVISRLDTYQKQKRHLYQVTVCAEPLTPIQPQTPVYANANTTNCLGYLSSFDGNHLQGLAVLKSTETPLDAYLEAPAHENRLNFLKIIAIMR